MKGSVTKGAFVYTALVGLAIMSLVPFFWMLFTSLKPLSEVESGSFLPKNWRPGNFQEVFA
jgi:ABC-type glycerol-3-phosphate transport system permease component